jgi:cytochrome P450
MPNFILLAFQDSSRFNRRRHKEALVPALTATTPPPRGALSHIPGEDGWPVIGSTFAILSDPKGFIESLAARHGLITRSHVLGETGVHLLGPAANELVLLDQQRNFSSAHGWGRFMDRVFPRGLMMMDFDEHRLHRRALSVAFKAGPMQAYLRSLNTGIAARVAQWRAAPGQMLFYPAMKQLTLDLASVSFLGASLGPDMDAIIAAFIDMVAATLAPIRRPLPGTQMRRGVQGRARIVAYFSRLVPLRREQGGEDLFSQLCRVTTEDGALLSPEAVVDHISFFMMAAHDTLTSSLSAFVMQLAANPAWQTKLRDEIGALASNPGEPLTFDRLEAMKLTEMAFKETLRLVPPVPLIPRRALRGFTFMGVAIPAGASVAINPLFTHHMPDLWPDPNRFDPSRFTDAAQSARHRHAFIPYGGGAHMCLGLHFAAMQAKCFTWHFLQNLHVTLPAAPTPWRMWPIPKPKDGLPIILAVPGPRANPEGSETI